MKPFTHSNQQVGKKSLQLIAPLQNHKSKDTDWWQFVATSSQCMLLCVTGEVQWWWDIRISQFWGWHYSGTNSPLNPKIRRSVAAYIAARRYLTHLGRVTHICVCDITIVGSDNGLSPGRRQAIIWTNAGILLIGPLGTKFSEILVEIHTFSFKKTHLKILSENGGHFVLASMC